MDAILLENNRCNQRAHPNTHWLGPPKSKGLLWTIYNVSVVHDPPRALVNKRFVYKGV